MTKKELVKELAENTFITLKPSGVHGIGVFAIRDIPVGCRNMFSQKKTKWVKLSKARIKELPVSSIALIENFCLWDDKNYYVPGDGFKMFDPVVFLNHSDTPNIKSINDGEFFEAITNIAAGEELFVDYDTIVAE